MNHRSGYRSPEEAKRSKRFLSDPEHATLDEKCPCGLIHVDLPKPARRETGFPARVKLLVRTRAGNGNPDAAMCEACGIELGKLGGQVHHIINRGMGGTSDPVLQSAANAALLCGTPLTGCHGLATAFDEEIGAKGFWLSHSADPRLEPMMLHSVHDSGLLVWRSADGRYLFRAPGEAAA